MCPKKVNTTTGGKIQKIQTKEIFSDMNRKLSHSRHQELDPLGAASPG